MRVEHTIDPVYDSRSRILVLGTIPSPRSREAGFYYMHPRNRFWPVIAALLGESVPEDVAGRRDLALRHGIALWDVLASCYIEGASDASIRDAVPNDLTPIFETADIRAVYTTGATSTRLFRKHDTPVLGVDPVPLPSTSPANARKSLDDLLESYSAILEHLL